MFAVTADPGVGENELVWLPANEHPTGKEDATYYVWYKFDGDVNSTESIPAQRYTSVISVNARDIAISGKTFEYEEDTPRKLAEGELDGKDIESETGIKYWVTSDEAASASAAADNE